MKRFLLFLVLLSVSFASYAEKVDKSTALKVAKTMVCRTDINEMATRNYGNLYIFSGENGFVIVSADDRVRPIIGYSDTNPFAINERMTNVNYWLNQVDAEIQYAIDNDIEASAEIKNEWKNLTKGIKPEAKNRTAVNALLKTKWDQDYPYNAMCPVMDGKQTVTGCVATSIAQVMKYWEWPPRGIGSHTYSYEGSEVIEGFEGLYYEGVLSADFSDTDYDWDNMKNNYSYSSYTEVEADAVATLMYHVGVSVEMLYGTTESASSDFFAVEGLVDYFDYKESVSYQDRWKYDDDEWIELLKSELNARRPILYSGSGEGGGHSFVCDGYDENDNFHFNWGWSGVADGYYAIGALSPGTGGIGSGSLGDYSMQNTAIIGIEAKGKEAPDYIASPTNVVATPVGDTKLELSWNAVDGAIYYGIYLESEYVREYLGTTEDTSTVITGLKPNTDYCFVVTAFDVEEDESAESEQVCATTGSGSGGDDTEVLPPSNVKAVAISSTTIRLSWDPVPGALAYGIMNGGNLIGATYETYMDIGGALPNSTYCFTVVSVTGIDNEGYITDYSEESEEACATTGSGSGGDDTEVLPPSNVKAVAISSTTIRLSWDPVPGALAYGVMYEGDFLGATDETVAEFEELLPNTTYCFKVFTITDVDAEGNIIGYSEDSEEACATTTVPDAVDEVTATFNMYPNPVEDKLYIETDVEIEDVVVYDVYGRQQDNVAIRQHFVDVSDLTSGTYLIKIVTNDSGFIRRFVKK
jgi:hypothetical protein